MKQRLALKAPLSIAIAENATTPAAAVGTKIWSTTSTKMLGWDGTAWTSDAGAALDNIAWQDILGRRYPSIVNGTPAGAGGQVAGLADYEGRGRLWAARPNTITPLTWGLNNNITGSTGYANPFGSNNETDAPGGTSRRYECSQQTFSASNLAPDVAGWYHNYRDVFLSDGANYGGFFFTARMTVFGAGTTQPNWVWFIGLSATVGQFPASTTTLPPNTIGFGQFDLPLASSIGMYSRGASVDSSVMVAPTGGNAGPLPSKLSTYRYYDLFLYNPRKTRTLYWGCRESGIENLPVTTFRTFNYGAGEAGLPLPQGSSSGNGVPLSPQLYLCNVSSTASPSVGLSHVYLETAL